LLAWLASSLQPWATATNAQSSPPVASRAPAPGQARIGQPAPPWHAERWINSPPLELTQLRGRVVLVRFWTAPDCPFCSASAPALNDFHARFERSGLTVIGFYHHKARSSLRPGDVERYAKQFHFGFPVATDTGWQTVRSWWLNHQPRGYTSASFLIDRKGVIRHIHPGGKYEVGDAAHRELQSRIEALLAEPG
jgi:peroxiredoxin